MSESTNKVLKDIRDGGGGSGGMLAIPFTYIDEFDESISEYTITMTLGISFDEIKEAVLGNRQICFTQFDDSPDGISSLKSNRRFYPFAIEIEEDDEVVAGTDPTKHVRVLMPGLNGSSEEGNLSLTDSFGVHLFEPNESSPGTLICVEVIENM